MELKGKIIDFLGDSITEGAGVSDVGRNRYDHVIERRCGLKAVYNYGVGGSRLAHQIRPSENPRHDLCFCGRAYDLNRDADIIVVFGGVNDYLHGDAPVGKEGDNTPATFCGAVEWLMSFLQAEYADKVIVFVTPAHCRQDQAVSDNPAKQADAMPLPAYIDVIERAAGRHGIPVLNLYEELGLDPNIPKHMEEYAPDGLHFNDKGHAVIAEKIIQMLEGL